MLCKRALYHEGLRHWSQSNNRQILDLFFWSLKRTFPKYLSGDNKPLLALIRLVGNYWGMRLIATEYSEREIKKPTIVTYYAKQALGDTKHLSEDSSDQAVDLFISSLKRSFCIYLSIDKRPLLTLIRLARSYWKIRWIAPRHAVRWVQNK